MTPSSSASLEWIELIYSAVEDSSQWDVLLNQFKERMRATLVSFSIQYSDRPDVSISKYTLAGERDFHEYATKWAQHDPWMARVMFGGYPVGVVVPSQDICPDEELEKTEFYKQWLKPRAMHYGGGVYLSNGTNQRAIFAMNRPKELGPLTQEEIEFWQQLVPHLSRAVRLHGEREQLRAQLETLRYYLDFKPIGVVLLTEQAKVLEMNATARALIGKGNPLYVEDGRLRVLNPREERPILDQIASAGARVLREDWSAAPVKLGSVVALIAPADNKAEARIASNIPTAALYLIDSHRTNSVSPDVLGKVYPFTPAESNVAALLVEGLSLEELAERLFISEHTARTHLKRIFAKTGCKRQAELVGVISRLVSHLPESAPKAAGPERAS